MRNDIRKPYRNIPVGISKDVTNVQEGVIYDVFYVADKDITLPIGRIGKRTGFSDPIYYASPTTWSPFANPVRNFASRRDAALYLLGLHESTQDWVNNIRNNPVCAVCNSVHAVGNCDQSYGVDSRNV